MPNQPSDLKSFLEAINGQDFLVLDTETTGLGPEAEICEIAIITANGETMYDEFVKPSTPISPSASAVHGITDEMVKNAFIWKSQQPAIARILNGNLVVTYNAKSARKFMHQSDRAWAMPETLYAEQSRWYCAMEAFAERYGNWNDYRSSYQLCKLIDAVGFYHITPRGEFHGALADALVTLDVVRCMEAEIRAIKEDNGYAPGLDFWKRLPGAAPMVSKGE